MRYGFDGFTFSPSGENIVAPRENMKQIADRRVSPYTKRMKTNDPQLTLSLIRQAQRGRQASIARLSRTVEGRIHRYIYRMTLDYHLTEDLCQDTLLEMVRHLGDLQIDSSASLWAWLHKTALNKIRGHYRKARNTKGHQSIDTLDEVTLADRLAKPGTSGSDRLIHQEVAQAVVRAMESLRLSYRSVLTLRCFDDLSYAEIAQVMGGSQLRARLLFFRAKNSLRQQLVRNGYGRMHLISGLTVFGAVTAGASRSASATVLVSESAVKTGLGTTVLSTATSKLGLTAAAAIVAAGLAIGSLSSSPAPPIPEPAAPSIDELFEAFTFPSQVSDSNDPDHDGWSGIEWREPNVIARSVDPPAILVDEPHDEEVALILPRDHWVELRFPGRLHNGKGPDLLVVDAEPGSMPKVLVISETNDPVLLVPYRSDLLPSGLMVLTYDFATLPEIVEPAAIRVMGAGAPDPNNALKLLRVQARTDPNAPPSLGT